jgi:cytochrome c-type biogenesis protein CcmH
MTPSTIWMIMTLAAAVFLAVPFLRAYDRKCVAAATRDIEACRDQLTQVDEEAAAGDLDGDQAETARAEITRRLVAAVRAYEPIVQGISIGERNFAAAAIAGVIVLGSVGLYGLDDSPDLSPGSASRRSAGQPGASAVEQLAAATQAQGDEVQSLNPAQGQLGGVDEMIARLTERLNRNPKDAEGWRMLGWSYFNTERFAQSAAAYAKAIDLDPANAELRSSRGEALVRAADGQVTEEAKAVFAQALRHDAKDPRGRFFLGLAKEQAGNKPAALDDWVAILNDTDTNEPWVSDLTQRVTELSQEIGIDVSARLRRSQPGGLLAMLQQKETGPAVAAPLAAAPPAAAPKSGGPSAEDVRNADAMTSSDRSAMIQGMVDRLATRLAQSPRDPEGWIKLMRSRKILGETEGAEQTFRFALDVFKDAPLEQEQLSAAARELGLIK